MQYSNEIEIHLPLEKTVALFDNPEHLKEWMPGLISFEAISGVPGQPGARAKLIFRMGKRMMEMTETVTVRNLPDEFSGTYEMKNVYNEVKNKFTEIGPDITKYTTESTFRFSGIMRFFSLFMKSTFKKTSQNYLLRFKQFAENHHH